MPLLAVLLAAFLWPTTILGRQASLVGRWVVDESAGRIGKNTILPLPFFDKFSITKEGQELVIESSAGTVLSYVLDGKPTTSSYQGQYGVVETTITARRVPDGITIESATREYHHTTTLKLVNGLLVVTRGAIIGGTGPATPGVTATYRRAGADVPEARVDYLR